MNHLPKRLQSIDVFRAITMLLMIFVNDVAGMENIPAWIDHVEASADGFGFADTVFPAFLFIVGLSLPFAIRNRINKGELTSNIIIYILSRSVALLVMGFFHVNAESYSAAAILPRSLWTIGVTISFFLVWLDYSPYINKWKKTILIATGILLLVVLAFLYKGSAGASTSGMKPHWWGILGIIGWSYLVCALVFLFTRGKMIPLVIVLALFIGINIAAHTGFLPFRPWIIGDASSATLVMAGIVISILYGSIAGKQRDHQLWLIFSFIGIIMLIAGMMIRPYAEGISKIRSTPAWVFICTGISVLIFEALIWLVDSKGKQNWFSIIRPAGTSTLTCYLLPYLLYSIYALLQFRYPPFLNEGVGGVLRSFAVAFFIIFITGILERKRIRLKI